MKNIITTLILTITTITAQAADEASRLVGAWRSDRELTMSTLSIDGAETMDPEKLQKFSELFGKKILTFTPTTIESYPPETPNSRDLWEYKVVSREKDKLTIEVKEGGFKNEKTYSDEKAIEAKESRFKLEMTFFFKGDDIIYTQTRKGGLSFDEHFQKIKSEEINEPNKPLGRKEKQ